MKKKAFYLFSMLIFLNFSFVQTGIAINLEKGEKGFKNNCIVCHAGGNNIIIPEKNLRKETLEANGMNTKSAIFYQVMNGKWNASFWRSIKRNRN